MTTPPILEISNLTKTYVNGFTALKDINLSVNKGEIFALLGPNGAGKTTLISTICGITNPSAGTVKVDGFDIVKDPLKTREAIGLVPQELTTDAFETVWATVNFSRGLFGKPKDHALVESILKNLSLWDKRNNKLMTLSGGMKRRVIIAKALSHEPRLLFLDEPTAGVDVELRKSMWQNVHELRKKGVTIILTTHYIEEAEEMADRIGIINHGEIVLVAKKDDLMKTLGKKQLKLFLKDPPLDQLPASLAGHNAELIGNTLTYTYDPKKDQDNIAKFLERVNQAGISFVDLEMTQSSLEDIFVDLVKR